MEDYVQYLRCLKNCVTLASRLIELVEEDKENSILGLSGEPEAIYRELCVQVSEKLNYLYKEIMILYSESSAGLI